MKLLYVLSGALLLQILSPMVTLADNDQYAYQDFGLIPCGNNTPIPYTGPVPTTCYAYYWFLNPLVDSLVEDPFAGTYPGWTLAEQFVAQTSAPLRGVSIFGTCGGDNMSGDCDAEDTVTITIYGVDNGVPTQQVATSTVLATSWLIDGRSRRQGCGNFFSCGTTAFVPFDDSKELFAGRSYAFTLSSLPTSKFVLSNAMTFAFSNPDIGGEPILGGFSYDDSFGRDPSHGATPELDSLILFGSGLAGLAGYGVLRWRGRPR